jgi:hypothetical protein
MKKRRKIIYIVILTLVILAIVLGILFLQFYKKDNKSNTVKTSGNSQPATSSGNSKPVYRTVTSQDYTNLEDVLKNNEIVQKLPDDATILLAFYNFNSGDRQWERSYLLTKGNVEQGTTENYDIKLIMHSKYLTVLNQNNLCNVLKTAKNAGDFGSETKLPKISLAWKFKSMLGYKDCLGL